MKISFIWFWNRASEIMPKWRDGLRRAIEYIAKTNEVDWFLDEKVPSPKDKYDALIFWGDSNCPFFSNIDNYECKKAICLSTNPINIENLKKLDAVYCETAPVYEETRRYGIRAIRAFGTDDEFFKPAQPRLKKEIEYFYPATFSPWKRQSSIAKLGKKLLCVGTLQPDGKSELEECQKRGVNVEIGYFPAEKIKEYYNRSRNVIIPAVHGSERTVLEAMSMNIIPIVEAQNVKAHSLVKECVESIYPTPRDFIINNYSYKKYAEAILKGIQ